ncbi:MAG: glycosyltransferase [Candidatus Heimdallarchaeota archaeon]
MPKISCIISTYNRSSLLKKAINSVLRQTLEDFELIVIDDCSTDNTEKVVKSFKDERVKYVKTKENCGHDGQPKNIGIRCATGEYVCFLDDDDMYRKKEAFFIMYNYLKHTGADVGYGDYITRIEGKKKKEAGWSVDFNPMMLAQRNYISMSVAFAKREKVVEVGGFNEELKQFKDWNLFMRLHKNGCRFIHVPVLITEVYQHEGTISSKNKLKYDENGNYIPTFNPADCKIYANKTIIGEKKPLKVAIFTLTMDRLDYTKEMYEAMKKTAGYDFDWHIIDQHSTDGTVEWLKELAKKEKNVFPLFLKENLGVAGGWMKAIDTIRDLKKYDIVIKVDNDSLLITDGWLDAMVDLFDRNKGLVLSPTVEGLEGTPGGVLRQRMDGQSPYVSINDKILGVVPNLGGIVFASYLEMYNGFEFPEDLPGNKDYYLSMAVKGKGFSLFYMEEYNVVHMDGSTGQLKKYPDYFKKTLKIHKNENTPNDKQTK